LSEDEYIEGSETEIYKDMTLDTVLKDEVLNDTIKKDISFLTPIKPIKQCDMSTANKLDLLSPYSKEIINRLNEDDARDYIEMYIKDNKLAKILEEKQEMDDPDFTYTSSSEVGILLEYWVCVNIKCPICKGELYKYALSNMPTIDVKCSNSEHTVEMGPKYFQIKATEANSMLYFTLNRFSDYMNGFITVGSIRPGKYSHEVKPSEINRGDIRSTNLLIGYICIVYSYYSANKRKIKLNLHKSFILFPKMKNRHRAITDEIDYYYKYIKTITGKPTIVYNPDFVNLFRFSSLVNSPIFKQDVFNSNGQIIISLDTKYDETVQIPEEMQREPPINAAVETLSADSHKIFDLANLTYKLKYLILKDII
jgi:hypothetical protein